MLEGWADPGKFYARGSVANTVRDTCVYMGVRGQAGEYRMHRGS